MDYTLNGNEILVPSNKIVPGKMPIPIPRWDKGQYDMTEGESCPLWDDPVDLAVFKEHAQEVQDTWNQCFREYDLPFTYEAYALTPACKDNDPSLVFNKPFKGFITGDDRNGRIWPNQIRTTVEVFIQILNNPGKCGIIIGSTMCGKTGTANNCHWYGPLLYLMNNGRRKFRVIIVAPPKKAIEKQTRHDYNNFKEFYGCDSIHLHRAGRSKAIRLKEYWQLMDFPQSELLFDNFNTELGDDSASPCARRTRGKQANRINKILKKTKELNQTAIVVSDEADFGPGSNSIQAKEILEPIIEKMKDYSLDKITMSSSDSIFIGFTATPFCFDVDNIWKAKHRLSDKYIGPNCYGGQPLDPDVKPQQVDYRSYAQAAEMANIPFLRDLCSAAYRSHDRFLKEVRRQSRQNYRGNQYYAYLTWEEYREETEKSIAKLVKYCLLHKNPKNGKGFILRWMNNNKDTEVFRETIAKYLEPEIQLLQYFETTQVFEHMIKYRDSDKPYLVLVTGDARMATRIPAEVKYVFEHSENANIRAIVQGLFGRETGNKADFGLPGLAIMSEKCYNKLDYYIQTDGLLDTNPTPYTDFPKRQTTHNKISILLDEMFMNKHSSMKVIWRKWRKAWETSGRFLGGYFDFWEDLASIRHLIECDKIDAESEFSEHPVLLMPGELDATKKGYAHDDERPNMAKIGFRTADRPVGGQLRSRGYSLKTDRFEPGGEGREDDNERLEIQAHFLQPIKSGCKATKKTQLVAVRLRLKEFLNKVRDRPLPNSSCFVSGFLTKEESDAMGGK